MKNKLILSGIIIAFIVVAIVIIIFNYSGSSFILENKEDGSIIITAKNASENSGEENKPSGEDKPEEGKPGENNSDGENQSKNQKPEKEQQKQPENKTPLEAVKDSLSNLKLPFTGTKDYGYISTPYFWINVLAILIVFAIYLLICRNENKDQ